MRLLLTCLLLFAFALPARAQQSYTIEKLAEGLFAAIARDGGAATSNAFFVVGSDYVLAGGAHFSRGAITDLMAAVAERTAKPVRYVVLAHHHGGYSHIDFDFPEGVDVIMSWQTWQALDEEVREVEFPALFFSEGLTLKVGGHTVILNNIGRGHTGGDVIAYLPESRTIFASDLAYIDSVGYMGEGFMEEWATALEVLGEIDARKIVPGYGPVSGQAELAEFRAFVKVFLTTVLEHIEQGDSLAKTLRNFTLPPRYRQYQGYERFLQTNIERAYRQLKDSISD